MAKLHELDFAALERRVLCALRNGSDPYLRLAREHFDTQEPTAEQREEAKKLYEQRLAEGNRFPLFRVAYPCLARMQGAVTGSFNEENPR